MSNFNTAEQSNQEISQDSLELNDEELDAVAGGYKPNKRVGRGINPKNGKSLSGDESVAVRGSANGEISLFRP